MPPPARRECADRDRRPVVVDDDPHQHVGIGVDDDELASGDFVLSRHAHDCRRLTHAQSGRTRTPPLSADAASMP